MRDGPKPPPGVYGHPDLAEEALGWLNGASVTLRQLDDPSLIHRGWLRVSVKDLERVLDIIAFAEEQVETACGIPNLDLWFRRHDFDEVICLRKTPTLLEFLQKGRRRKRVFEKALGARRDEIDALRKHCQGGIQHAQQKSRQELRRSIVKELSSEREKGLDDAF